MADRMADALEQLLETLEMVGDPDMPDNAVKVAMNKARKRLAMYRGAQDDMAHNEDEGLCDDAALGRLVRQMNIAKGDLGVMLIRDRRGWRVAQMGYGAPIDATPERALRRATKRWRW